MKFWTLLLVGLLLISSSALGDLSVADWEKLTRMFKESEARTQQDIKESEARTQQDIKESEARTQQDIKESEARTKEFVGQEGAKVTLRIDETNKRIETESQGIRDRFGDVNLRLNFNFGLMVALVAGIIGLPLLRERKKEREQDEKIAMQQQLIEALQAQLAAVLQELETLKQHQAPSASATE